MRRGDALFTRGTLTTLAGNDAGPGVLAYRRDLDGRTAIILFNTADRPVLMTDMDSQLPEGTVLELVQGLVNQENLVVGREGRMTMELAGREGQTVLPRLNAEAPAGFNWDRMIFAEGWGVRLFSSEGADENAQGTAVTPAPEVTTDQDARTVTFLLPAESLGNPEALEGAQVYVTTWDWNGIDAVLRPNDRFANRVYEAPAGVAAETVEIVIEGWWDR